MRLNSGLVLFKRASDHRVRLGVLCNVSQSVIRLRVLITCTVAVSKSENSALRINTCLPYISRKTCTEDTKKMIKPLHFLTQRLHCYRLFSHSPARATEYFIPNFTVRAGVDRAAAAPSRNAHFSSSICRIHRRALSFSHSSLPCSVEEELR